MLALRGVGILGGLAMVVAVRQTVNGYWGLGIFYALIAGVMLGWQSLIEKGRIR